MKTCGLDVHKDTIFCAIYDGKDSKVERNDIIFFGSYIHVGIRLAQSAECIVSRKCEHSPVERRGARQSVAQSADFYFTQRILFEESTRSAKDAKSRLHNA